MSVRRNSLFNLAGNGLPLLVGAISIPYLISRIGLEAFGILTLIWALIGYFSFFDFGLGRALTQQIAATNASGAILKLPGLVKSGVWFTAVAGALGGIILAATADSLADNWLNISPARQPSAYLSLVMAAVGIPFTTITAGLRGILEGYEDFKVVNVLRVLLGVANFGLPVITVFYFGDSLPWTVATLIAARFVILLLHAWYVYQKLRVIWVPTTVNMNDLKGLLSFGGWMTLSNVISPLMVTADRFIISALLGAGVVAFYTVPFEALSRVLIVPAALAAALFPRLAAKMKSDSAELRRLYRKSLLRIAQVLFPISLGLILGSKIGLASWISPEFAESSWLIVCIMAVGLFFNGVAFIPFSLIQAAGNARETALLHVLEIILYFPILFLAIELFGLLGAALAWTLRAMFDSIALLLLSKKYVA